MYSMEKKQKLVTIMIGLHEYEQFRRRMSKDTTSYYDKTKEVTKTNISRVVQRLLKRYLDGEIALDMNEDIESSHRVQRGILVDIDLWVRANEHILKLEKLGKVPRGRLGGIVIRLIHHYINLPLEDGEKLDISQIEKRVTSV